MTKSQHLDIIRLYAKETGASIHLRAIARQTGLNVNSASRFLSQLERQGVLRSEREGSLKKYSLRPGDRTFLLLTTLDLERLESLPGIRRKAIQQYLASLSEQPLITFLFGSTAKGTFRKDSDIDLLLVVNRRVRTEAAENKAEAQTGLRVNALQVTFPEFLEELRLRKDKVLQAALEHGYPLTNHMGFHRVHMRATAGETDAGPLLSEPEASLI